MWSYARRRQSRSSRRDALPRTSFRGPMRAESPEAMSNVVSLFGKKARKGEYGQGSVNFNKRDGLWVARVCLEGERHYLGGYPTEEEGWHVIAAFWDDYAKQNIVGPRGQKLGAFGQTCLDDRELEGDVMDIRSERSRWR